MRLTGLHPLSRYRPHPFAEIDLGPGSTDSFACSGRGQNDVFEDACGDPLLSSELAHERTDLRIGQRPVVLDPSDLGFPRQQVFEMAAPASRVLTLPVAACRGPVEDCFDPPPH